MKKRILSILLALCMVVCFTPFTVSAMTIYVDLNIAGAQNLTLEVVSGDSIDNVKEKIEEQTGMPADKQILSYKGRMLTDGRTLVDYNIQKETTINLTKEQFNLEPGGKYYFDLSNLGITDKAYEYMLDKTMHYVPFTYAGTIVAYRLGDATATTEDVAEAFSYAHSVFMADESVAVGSWDEFNDKDLILFGSLETYYGVKYYVHAPSAGSASASGGLGGPGIPRNNEWDTILDKNEGYIRDTNQINSSVWGQDTTLDSPWQRITREGSINVRYIGRDVSYATYNHYRPILEIANAYGEEIDPDRLKAVTLNLGGGWLGYSTDSINIVVKNGEAFKAPAKEGLRRPDNNTGSYFMWYGDNGRLYAPGAEVPSTVTSLTAKWSECDHSDSKVKSSCTDSAICTVCGGTIAALGHDFSEQKYDDNNHWKKCSRCDETANTEPHNWDTGVIVTSPTCTTKGERKFTCNKCSVIKIESISASGHNWGQEWKYDEAHHWHECLNSNCDAKDSYSEHVGGTATCTAKAVCDLCHQPYGEVNPANHEGGTQQWTTRTTTVHEKKWSCCGAVSVASEAHEWADGVCSECEYVCLHDDADKNHVCDICEKTISDHDDANKDHVCDYCGKTISDHEDADKDHKCDYCGKLLSDHAGGKATCKDKAICSECGESYGEVDSNNHADLEHISAKAATKKDKGNIEYWYCDDCGKYFSDAAATDEITKSDTVTEKLPNDKKDNKGKNNKNERDDKKGTDDKKSPKTGDTANLALWYALLLASGVIILAKKKKINND